jgi:hypothetical protein
LTAHNVSALFARLDKVLKTFEANVASVSSLMEFDTHVIGFAIQQLETLQERLVNVHEIRNARLDVSRALDVLRGIRKNDSLQTQYDQVLNQCNVLLVSYFSSAAQEVFRASVSEAVREGHDESLLKQDIKITLRDIREIGLELVERAGELLALHRDISFQDMQSISRAFREHFNVTMSQDETVNDIICSQACRHVIVHSGAVADRRMIGQLRAAKPRSLKPDMREGDRVQFTEAEVRSVGLHMTSYLRMLIERLTAKVPGSQL